MKMNGQRIYESTHVGEGAPVIRTDLIRAACDRWLAAHGLAHEDSGFNGRMGRLYRMKIAAGTAAATEDGKLAASPTEEGRDS
jgi:hypothetical protein